MKIMNAICIYDGNNNVHHLESLKNVGNFMKSLSETS